jgi:hypothetical protein
MIRNIKLNGMIGPVIYCDTCGERIDEAGRALVLTREKIGETQTAEVMHVHKGPCHHAAESKTGSHGWQELSRHLLHLVYNAGLSLEDLQLMKLADAQVGGVYFSPLCNG